MNYKIGSKVLVDLDGIINTQINDKIPTDKELEKSYIGMIDDISADMKALGKSFSEKEIEEGLELYIQEYKNMKAHESIIETEITCIDKHSKNIAVGVRYGVHRVADSNFKKTCVEKLNDEGKPELDDNGNVIYEEIDNPDFEYNNENDICYWISENHIVKVIEE